MFLFTLTKRMRFKAILRRFKTLSMLKGIRVLPNRERRLESLKISDRVIKKHQLLSQAIGVKIYHNLIDKSVINYNANILLNS